MCKLNCENPVILINHEIKLNINRYRKYVYLGKYHIIDSYTAGCYKQNFPLAKFSPKRNNITLDDVDSCYFIDQSGCVVPLYIVVPCGKCLMCRDRKAREWSFRAVCENKYSTSEPLFLTLTYNNAHLPSCGIFKEEIQLFMKRLRRNLDRAGIIHDIRYYACGEYGSLSKRPHYHMILWNFPEMKTMYQRLKMVEKSWSLPTGKYRSNGAPVTKQIGFAYCVPCKHGAISYVMKYMKKQYTPPPGMNDVFFLSSRKNGGIGAAFARENKDFYRKNPTCLTMSVLDPYSGQTFESYMPSYYKNLIFPSNSKLLKKSDRDAYELLKHCISLRPTYTYLVYNDETKIPLAKYEIKILRQFSFLNSYISTKKQGNIVKLYDHLSYEKKQQLLLENEELILSCIRTLTLVKYDTDYVSSRPRIAGLRKSVIDALFSNSPEPDIINNRLTLINRINTSISKEKL